MSKFDTDATREAIEDLEIALEAFAAAFRRLPDSAVTARFRAYHLAEVEGTMGGDWMGGPFLRDALHDLRGDLFEDEGEDEA